MTDYRYIFDETYASSLDTLVKFIDQTNSWDIYQKMEFSYDYVPNDIFKRVGLKNLSDETKTKLFADIKFMCEFTDKDVRKNNFKKHYCSTRLFDHMEKNNKKMCQTAYNVIVDAECWEYFKKFEPNASEGFMWTKDEIISGLLDKITQVDQLHSGSSLAFTMRELEYVAKTGLV